MKKEKFSEKLRNGAVKNTFYNILTSLINKIGGVVFMVLVARILQPRLFGIYSLSIAIAGVFLVFADLGINASLIRYTAYAFEKSEKKAASYFQYLLKVKALLISIVFLLLLILAKPISEVIFKKPDLFWPLIFCSIFIISYALLDFFTSIFFSLGKVKYVAIREVIAQIGRIGLFIVLGVFLLKSFLVISAILAFSLGFLFALIFMLFILITKNSFLFSKTSSLLNSEKKALFAFIGVLAFAGIIGTLNVSIDTLLLGVFLKNPAYIGFYRAALTIVTSAVGIIAFGNVFLPIFTQIKNQELSRTFEKVFDYCLILAFPIAFGIAIVSRQLVALIFGITYLQAAIPLMISAFVIIPSALSSVYSMLFYAKEKPLKPTIILAITTVINILLNLFLITLFLKQSEYLAIIGAAIAITVSGFIYLIIISILAKKQYKIIIKKRVFAKALLSCIIMSIVLMLLSSTWLKEISALNLVLQILIGLAVYVVLMFLFKGIIKEDFELIKKVVRK